LCPPTKKPPADKNGALNTEISFSASHETDSIRVQDNSLILCGRLSDNDLAYYARLCVTTDGEMVKGDGNAAEPGTEGISYPGSVDGGCQIKKDSSDRESNRAS